jgi:hypothetical protein
MPARQNAVEEGLNGCPACRRARWSKGGTGRDNIKLIIYESKEDRYIQSLIDMLLNCYIVETIKDLIKKLL